MLTYIVEFLGTFLFLSVIVATGQPFLIALALLLAILLGGSISGGHFNPAVSLMFWAKGSLTGADLLGYIAAQVAGGLGAVTVYNFLTR
jgi:aquaporin Z